MGSNIDSDLMGGFERIITSNLRLFSRKVKVDVQNDCKNNRWPGCRFPKKFFAAVTNVPTNTLFTVTGGIGNE